MDGFLEFEPGMVMFKVNDRLIAEKFSRLTWEKCGPGPVLFRVIPCHLPYKRWKRYRKACLGSPNVPGGPIPGGPQLPAVVSRLFALNISFKCGQGRGPTAGPWAPSGGL